jgi:hypothetical protein
MFFEHCVKNGLNFKLTEGGTRLDVRGPRDFLASVEIEIRQRTGDLHALLREHSEPTLSPAERWIREVESHVQSYRTSDSAARTGKIPDSTEQNTAPTEHYRACGCLQGLVSEDIGAQRIAPTAQKRATRKRPKAA